MYPVSQYLTMITQAETAPYNLAAVGRRWLSHPDARIFWTKFVIALGFLSGFLLSRKLWVSTRFFPLTPVIHKLPRIPYPVDYIYFAALLVLLVVIALSPSRGSTFLSSFPSSYFLLCWINRGGSRGPTNISLCWRRWAFSPGRATTHKVEMMP